MSTPLEPPEPTTHINSPPIIPVPDSAAAADTFNIPFLRESFDEDDADLRGLSALPFEKHIARCLRWHNHEGNLGDRSRAFRLAAEHCDTLLREGKRNDVTRILAHVNRDDLIQSLIHHPGQISSSLLNYITKDREPFDNYLRLITSLSEQPDPLTWEKTSTGIIDSIEAFPLPQISHRAAVRRFLDRCVDEHISPYHTSDETRARAAYLLFRELSLVLLLPYSESSSRYIIELDCLSAHPLPPPLPRCAFITKLIPSFLSHPLSHLRTRKKRSRPKPSSTPAVLDLNNSFPPFDDTATNFPTIIPNHPPPIPLPSDAEPSLVHYFQAEVYLASLNPNNADLRPLSALPFEECLARVLCSYDHQYPSYDNDKENDDENNKVDGSVSTFSRWWKLGDRSRIFNLAQRHLTYLLGEGKHDDVARILSHVSPFDLIKSFIHHPRFISFPLVRFIVHDCKHEILDQLNEFVHTVEQVKFDPIALSDVFVVLASPPPPPTNIDLSPLISYLARHTDKRTWQWTTETVFAYLDSYNLAGISDLGAVRRFLRLRLRFRFRVDFYEDYDGDGDVQWSVPNDEVLGRANRLLAGEVFLVSEIFCEGD